ncbi:GntR family transcriptional regulator [Paracoccus sp. Z330]|uniref:GntR family transcriptional regulator n=1 Tax=Paracoccus onchidii TaxID=3017813 RepID=A0ABT4ZJJ2_9RHOB|nr:GntR family transcriptional regulator [Paracoccus onchidii]MDB6179534.1 GntR family transcriptional regulator [Paracoccus onchidii]
MNESLMLKPVDDGTVRRRIAQRLTDHIVSGGFAPGQKLTEQQLASALQVSRGPLREAVRELAEMGLLVSIPYRGLFVRSISRQDLEELYSLRTKLESFAFELLWDRRTPEALDDLGRRHATLKKTIEAGDDSLQAIEQELFLHNWCFELCGHNLLRRTWQGMQPHVNFYFSLHQKAHDRKGPLRDSHDVYVSLAQGDNLQAMLEHLKDHMRQGLARTIAELSTDLPEA